MFRYRLVGRRCTSCLGYLHSDRRSQVQPVAAAYIRALEQNVSVSAAIMVVHNVGLRGRSGRLLRLFSHSQEQQMDSGSGK